MSLAALPFFWLSAGLVLLGGIARASYDRTSHPFRLGHLSDAWKWARISLTQCLEVGDSRARLARAAGLSALFFAIWFVAHDRLRGLHSFQAIPPLAQAVGAVVCGIAAWLLMFMRSRMARVSSGLVAAGAWWSLPMVEAAVSDIRNEQSATDVLLQLATGPSRCDLADHWLASAPAVGPISVGMSLWTSLLFVRALPSPVIGSQRALFAWAAAAAAAGALLTLAHVH